MRIKAILAASLILVETSAYAAEVNNTGRVLAVGQLAPNICRVKIEGANFTGACNTATYHEAYFTCNSQEGKESLAIALTAYMNDKPVRITSTGCSIYGSSVANLTGINLE